MEFLIVAIAVPASLGLLLMVVGLLVTAGMLFLTLRVARRETRIRPGLDIARLVIGAGAVVVMGAIVGVQTPLVLAALAIAAGFVVGFAQGRGLEISFRDGTLFARRTLVGLAVWVVGIVAMQSAGLLNRTGVWRIGQIIAVFGVFTALGLLAGRNRPIGEARRRSTMAAGAAMVLLVPLAALALASGATASAQPLQLTDAEVCDLTPISGSWAQGVSSADSDLSVFGIVSFQVSVPTAVAACSNTWELNDGASVWVGAYLMPSEEQAASEIQRIASSAQGIAELVGTLDGSRAGDTLGIGAVRIDFEFDQLWITRVGPFIVYGHGEKSVDSFVPAIESMLERMGETIANLEAAASVAPTGGDGDTGEVTTGGDGTGDSTRGSGGSGGSTTGSDGTTGTGDDRVGWLTEGDITSDEALASAVATVAAAIAIGALTLAEGQQTITDLFGGGRGDAGTGGTGSVDGGGDDPPPPPLEPLDDPVVDDSLEPAVSQPTPSPSSVPGGATQPAQQAPPPTLRRTTVVLTGKDAERAIRDGVGGRVKIPTGNEQKDQASLDQQWGLDVRDDSTGEVHKSDHIGTEGQIEEIGPVATDEHGNTVVTVEVAVGPPPVGPPAAPQPGGVDIDVDPRPPEAPWGPGPPRPPPPPPTGVDIDEEPRPPEAPWDPEPPRPPPPEPEDKKPPVELEPEKRDDPDPPPPPPEPTKPEAQPESRPPDISEQETRDIVRRGIEHNRSPDDIKQDLDGLSHARGGGDVPLPDWVESVETPKGAVTTTGPEAEEYRRALTELQEASDRLGGYRDLILGNQKEITKWSEREQNWVVRWMAGLDHLREERLRFLAERRALEDELARINRRPDPMTYDGELFDSYEDAKNPARRAQLSSEVRDRMGALERDHKKRVERATETTEFDGKPYPMPADIYDAAYDREDSLADKVSRDGRPCTGQSPRARNPGRWDGRAGNTRVPGFRT